MGIDEFQQMRGEAGKFRVYFKLHPGSQKGKAFKQAFHIRIGAFKTIQRKTTRYLWKFAGKLPSDFAEMA